MDKMIYLIGKNQGGYVNICEKAFFEETGYLNDEFDEDLNDLMESNEFYELSERTYEISDAFRIGEMVVDKYGPVWPDPREIKWNELHAKMVSMGFEHSKEAEDKFSEDEEDEDWDDSDENWDGTGEVPYGENTLPTKE